MNMLYGRPKQETQLQPEQETEKTPKEQKETKKETPKQFISEQETPKEAIQEQPSNEQEPQFKQEKKKIKFLHAVPKFVGRELEVYGPFESGDTGELMLEVAKILIDKGKAEEVN